MRIAVAMSGGIDSTAVAYILQKAGHDVFGITMKHFDDQKYGFSQDKGLQIAIDNAKRICDILKINHYVIDVSEKFRDIVVKNFLSEYENGRTPNPCVLCNPTIKFGELLDKSVDLGAEFMATGHYVQLKEINSLIHIFRPKDKKKDQTYMLWDLSQEQFAKVKFPLADYTKDEIRKITSKFDLQTSIQKDSQEICFIKDSYTEYIRDKIEYKKGDVILENYGKIGEHKGLPFYTIGQRKGLGISWESPIYIKKLDTKKNQIIVTDKKENLTESVFYIKNTNWINEPKNKELEVQIRYNSKPVIVKSITESTDKYKVELHEKAMSITPGQSAVFYSDDELIGGGIIE